MKVSDSFLFLNQGWGLKEGRRRAEGRTNEGRPDKQGPKEGQMRDKAGMKGGTNKGQTRDERGLNKGKARVKQGTGEARGSNEGWTMDKQGMSKGRTKDKQQARDFARDKWEANKGWMRGEQGTSEGQTRDKRRMNEGQVRDKWGTNEGQARDKQGPNEGHRVGSFLAMLWALRGIVFLSQMFVRLQCFGNVPDNCSLESKFADVEQSNTCEISNNKLFSCLFFSFSSLQVFCLCFCWKSQDKSNSRSLLWRAGADPEHHLGGKGEENF